MRSIVLSRIQGSIEASPRLLEATRTALAITEQVLPIGNRRITRNFRMFSPCSAGTARSRAALTILAANQTFPLLLELLSRTGRSIEAPVPIETYSDNGFKKAAAERLQELCDHYGSDKARHGYHLLYGPLLAGRESIAAVLEIGLGTNNVDVVSNMGSSGRPGASLRAFRDFLPQAQIFGGDVDRRVLFAEDRISTFFVDQTKPESFAGLAKAVDGIEFDLIIDDGLHSPNANLATLLFGLDRLRIGGSLVVEDIAPSALPLWQLVAALLPLSYEAHVIAAKKAFVFQVRRLA